MGFKSDIEIAQEATPIHIREVAAKIGLTEDDIELYGKYKAKVDYNLMDTKPGSGKKAKLILTTAINPTPAGEGKTTTTVGVGDALAKLGKNVVLALREPSLGPVFGVKGGAAGGGYDGEGEEKIQKVTLNEVAHSIFYAPQYVAIENGYFECSYYL